MAKNSKWSNEEINILKEKYPSLSNRDMENFLIGRTWSGIKRKAVELNIHKDKSNSLEVLLRETPESYYWIGFLLADGSFSCRAISLSLSKRDNGHLIKFCNYIKHNNIKLIKNITYGKYKCEDQYRIDIYNKEIIKLLNKKFEIKINKTENPPKALNKIKNKDLFFSLLIGYIDGDAYIQPNHRITIQLHKNWLPTLRFFEKFIYSYFNIKHKSCCIIDNKGFSKLRIYKKILHSHMKQKALDLNLPILERKWNGIILDNQK